MLNANIYHKFITANGNNILIPGCYSVSAAHIKAQRQDKTAKYIGITVKW